MVQLAPLCTRCRALVVLALAGLLVSLSARAETAPTQAAPAKLELAYVHAVVTPLAGEPALFLKNAQDSVPIASLTKLMTALVIVEGDQRMGERLEIEARVKPAPNNPYSRLRVGSKLSRGELMRIMLMASENLAAYNLATHYPGGLPAFVDEMNTLADRFAMTGTTFVGPSGLNPGNQSTAIDLARLLRVAYDYPALRDYTTTRRKSVRFSNPAYSLPYGNTNPLVGASGWQVQLSKTGYLNEAGRCLAMVTVIGSKPMIFVFLNSFGSRTPMGDAGRVRSWLKTGRSRPIAAAASRYEQRHNPKVSGPTAN